MAGVLGAGVLATIPACSGPDPGFVTFATRPGAGPVVPGGTDAGGGPDPVFGDTTIAYVDPGVAANTANAAHAGTVEGKDCVVAGCHLDGARPYIMGGTVYSSAQGGATVPKAEVKMVDPAGVEIAKAYTDTNGNFWVLAEGKTITVGSRTGVRREGGAAPLLMTQALAGPTDAGCGANRSNCHGTAGTGKVYIP